MARIVVIGAGVVGLGAAMFLAGDGHQVVVLERDPAPPPNDPAEAWQHWQRPGVNQFRQPHGFLAGFRSVLDAELPAAELHLARNTVSTFVGQLTSPSSTWCAAAARPGTAPRRSRRPGWPARSATGRTSAPPSPRSPTWAMSAWNAPRRCWPTCWAARCRPDSSPPA